MFAKFHNTLQDSSYESRKKERKITNKISNRLFRLDHALQLIFAPSSRRQCTFPNCYVAHIAIYNKVAGKVLVAPRTKESAAWISCPVWETVDTDRSCRSDRTIEASCPREVEQTHPESTVHPLETDPCWLVSASVDPPCFTFPRSSCLSLSLSRLDLSLLSRFWLAFALIIANPKTPMREILPRRTISSLYDLRGILVIRSHTFLGGSLLCWLLVNRVESRPALGSLILMVRWLGRQRVAPGLGVVPR